MGVLGGPQDSDTVSLGGRIFYGFTALFGLGLVVLAVKGYAVSVTARSVIAHGPRDHVLQFEEIQSVEVVERMTHIYQMGNCLCFHLTDGTEYVHKQFNAGPSQSGKGYERVLAAKALIDQRLAELHGEHRVHPLPPPPPGAREGHGWGGPGDSSV